MARRNPKGTHAEQLGRRIRERRLELGLSQSDVATRAGISVGKISELENGRSGSRGPTLARLYQVAGALNTPISELLIT
jgi:transcriptional regulator with XRE-family HTH domain